MSSFVSWNIYFKKNCYNINLNLLKKIIVTLIMGIFKITIRICILKFLTFHFKTFVFFFFFYLLWILVWLIIKTNLAIHVYRLLLLQLGTVWTRVILSVYREITLRCPWICTWIRKTWQCHVRLNIFKNITYQIPTKKLNIIKSNTCMYIGGVLRIKCIVKLCYGEVQGTNVLTSFYP